MGDSTMIISGTLTNDDVYSDYLPETLIIVSNTNSRANYSYDLSGTLWNSINTPEEIVIVEDLNYDGLPDIRFVSATNSYGYKFWTFLLNSGDSFISNNDLKDECNLTLLSDKNFIHTMYRIGLTEFGHSLYKFDQSRQKYVLLIKETFSTGGEYAEMDIWSQEVEIPAENQIISKDVDFYPAHMVYNPERLISQLE